MKKILTTIFALVLAIAAGAQTLNVQVGNVTYMFPAAQTGEMTYSDGTTLTVMGRAFTLADITSMTIDNSTVTDNLVSVSYSSAEATVRVAGNVARYVEPTVSGAHVSIAQSNTDAVDGDEITYQLSGTSSDGEFTLDGSYKCTVSLAGLTLTNPSGAAINIGNKKRIQISAKQGTENTLADGTGGTQKGCIYSKGQIQLQGKGTLTVYGNTAHAIKSGDYISVKNLTLNVLSAVKDGISCNGYFIMKSGNVSISGTQDDALQCDLDGTESTGETADHEDEDSGNIYIEGGTLTVNSSATAAKGLKAEGDISITDGTVSITTTGGGTWDSDDAETKAACGISSDASISIAGGTVSITATGSGGKGMKCDGTLTVSGGNVTVKTTGGLYYNNGKTEYTNYTGDTDRIVSSYYSSPKGIKAGVKDTSGNSTAYSGSIVISGGTVSVSTSGSNGEGIESKNTLYINGGTVTVDAYDDAINSAREMYITDGTITVTAANNDGIDSNANLYIKGGTIIACGASGAECGLDAAERYSLYITGGTVLAVGGSNNAVSTASGSQCVLSTSGSVSAGSTVKVTNGSTTLASFTIPSTYSTSGGSGMGGGPGGNSGGSRNMLISCAGLTSGTKYTVTAGSSSTSVTAATTTSGNMGGGPGGR